MYPLLLRFSEDYSGRFFDALSFVAENIGGATVKNGRFSGENIKTALQKFGKECFGENGIKTLLFRESYVKKPLYELIENEAVFEFEDREATIYPFGVVNNVLNNELLTADRLFLNGRTGVCEDKSFLLIFCLESDLTVSDFDSTVKVKKGECVFLPAKMRVEITGEAEILLLHC